MMLNLWYGMVILETSSILTRNIGVAARMSDPPAGARHTPSTSHSTHILRGDSS